MILILRLPVEIDPSLASILDLGFIRRECSASDQVIKAVKASHLLYSISRCPACYHPRTREIILDVAAPMDKIIENLKGRFPGICSETAWRVVLLHEIAHADPQRGELECDEYALKRLGWEGGESMEGGY